MCGKEEWKMRKMSLEDFVKYAKEEFDCDIICNFDDEPDTFEKIFGTSFLANDEDENQLFPDNEALEYDNVRPDILSVTRKRMIHMKTMNALILDWLLR